MKAYGAALGLWMLAAVSGAAEPEGAQVFEYALGAGATYTDNAGRADADRESETTVDIYASADFSYERDRLTARLVADLRHSEHNYGDYEDQLNGGLSASGTWRVAPWVSWSVENNLGQTLVESRNVVRPDNMQNTNYFSTGPDFRLPLGSRTSLELRGRWSDIAYEVSDFDTQNLAGTFGVRRQIGAESGVSLNVSAERVEQQDLPESQDYEVRSAYLSWDATGARTSIALSAGASELDDGEEFTRGALFELDFDRRLTARSAIAVNVGRNFGSAADLMRREQIVGDVAVDDRPGIASSDPMRADYATVAWRLDAVRSSLGLSVDVRRERHRVDTALNRNAGGAGLELSHQLLPRFAVRFAADYRKEDFTLSGVNVDEWYALLGASWNMMPGLYLGADWTHAVGDGDTSEGSGLRDYTENSFALRLTWSPPR